VKPTSNKVGFFVFRGNTISEDKGILEKVR
jgi:hypothetical protein